MRYVIASLLLASTFSNYASAEDCNTEQSTARWQKLEDSKFVYGGGMIKNVPTFSVNEASWNNLSYNARLLVAKDFACLLAGPGKALLKARVVNKGGKLLAEWDGVSRELDIKQ